MICVETAVVGMTPVFTSGMFIGFLILLQVIFISVIIGLKVYVSIAAHCKTVSYNRRWRLR